jgi:hypothetical protein
MFTTDAARLNVTSISPPVPFNTTGVSQNVIIPVTAPTPVGNYYTWVVITYPDNSLFGVYSVPAGQNTITVASQPTIVYSPPDPTPYYNGPTFVMDMTADIYGNGVTDYQSGAFVVKMQSARYGIQYLPSPLTSYVSSYLPPPYVQFNLGVPTSLIDSGLNIVEMFYVDQYGSTLKSSGKFLVNLQRSTILRWNTANNTLSGGTRLSPTQAIFWGPNNWYNAAMFNIQFGQFSGSALCGTPLIIEMGNTPSVMASISASVITPGYTNSGFDYDNWVEYSYWVDPVTDWVWNSGGQLNIQAGKQYIWNGSGFAAY